MIKTSSKPSRPSAWWLVAFIIFIASQSLLATPIRVITVIEDFGDIARSIGGNLIHVESLTTGSKNLHNIHAKPSMAFKLKSADAIIRLGMKQDSWVDGLLSVARNNKLNYTNPGYINASTAIVALDVPSENVDGRHGDVHIEGNPHYWLSPYNTIRIAALIRDRLIAISPEHAQIFHTNYDAYTSKMIENIQRWRKQLEVVKKHQFITYHSTWERAPLNTATAYLQEDCGIVSHYRPIKKSNSDTATYWVMHPAKIKSTNRNYPL